MPHADERRRVLLAACEDSENELRPLFQEQALRSWELLTAGTFEAARFVLHHSLCDVLVVDGSLYQQHGPDGMAWLVRLRELPIVLLADHNASELTAGYEHGAQLVLPRLQCLEQPRLLAAGLRRAAEITDLIRAQRRGRETLHLSRRQVDRLVNLLWCATPTDSARPWLTQRHVMERLHEELARSRRHNLPLTVAVGEVEAKIGTESQLMDLEEWTNGQVNHNKRRCDVAGQYGLKGFLLLMVNTPPAGGVACCRRLQRSLEQPDAAAGGPYGPVRSYFGLASFDAESATPQRLLSTAEQHLMQAKARASTGERIVADLDGSWPGKSSAMPSRLALAGAAAK